MSPTEPTAQANSGALWRHRARVAEAALLLLVARLVVARVAFGRWRSWFGEPAPTSAEPHSRPLPKAEALRARRVGRAVFRAAHCLPGEYKCLPQAMAACWMLQRRTTPYSLVFGVTETGRRGSLDDLHAWVSCGMQVIVGGGEPIHAPILVLHGTG